MIQFDKVRQPTIRQAWRSYRELVLPPRQTPEFLENYRLAFYAGAATLFYAIMLGGLDEGEEPTEADMQRMDNINQEIKDFTSTFDAEVLKRHGGQQ